MAPLLEMRNISKQFPGVKALDHVSFDLKQGEVHALVGENGAGKSTLMKILSGAYFADEGELYINGGVITPEGPRAMIDHGIGVIYQELNLIPHLSVAENVFLGREPMTNAGTIDWKTLRSDFTELLRPFDVSIEPTKLAGSIGPAYQQVVEIVKALSLNARVLVMDEPTAPLTGREVDSLLATVKRLRDSGVGIVYISHRLEEIWEIADRVTVLRDGTHVTTKPIQELTIGSVIQYMVGRDLAEKFPKSEAKIGTELLRVQGLSKAGVCNDISFSLRAGEILGFAGLVGAGRTEIMQLLFGYRKRDAGNIEIDGNEVHIRNTTDAVRAGIALIPEERKRQGLVLGESVFNNASLAVLDRFSRVGKIQFGRMTNVIKDIVASIGVRTPSIHQLVKNLSGGNQQKVVLAKWFIRDCKIYIFDEPTRGIDVGAKVEIYRLMHALAARGAGIIMISSELPEVMNMSDRLIVIHRGSIAGEFARGTATDEEVMRCAFGVKE